GGASEERSFAKSDQFGAEIDYFSDCILQGREPEPSGEEGLIDVQIVRAAYRSCESGRAIPLELGKRKARPEPGQVIRKPAVEAPELLHARMPSGEKKKE